MDTTTPLNVPLVPLISWFCRNRKLAIPLIAIQSNYIKNNLDNDLEIKKLWYELRVYNNFIIKNNKNTKKNKKKCFSNLNEFLLDLNKNY